MKWIIAVALIFVLAFSGCLQKAQKKESEAGNACIQVISFAISPSGECKQFATPCDIPNGYTKVDKCDEKAPEKQTQPAAPKYSFETNLLFCRWVASPGKYIFFYQIRNYTDNLPKKGSKVWLFAPDINFAQSKTIQNEYENGQLIWEDNLYTFEGSGYRGQDWEVRDVNKGKDFTYKLIFCEPQYGPKELCNETNGILLDSNSTAQK